jgi:hypothetical protein
VVWLGDPETLGESLTLHPTRCRCRGLSCRSSAGFVYLGRARRGLPQWARPFFLPGRRDPIKLPIAAAVRWVDMQDRVLRYVRRGRSNAVHGICLSIATGTRPRWGFS